MPVLIAVMESIQNIGAFCISTSKNAGIRSGLIHISYYLVIQIFLACKILIAHYVIDPHKKKQQQKKPKTINLSN